MVRSIMTAIVLLFAQGTTAIAAPTCAGPDPTITGVAVKSTTPDGDLNRYELSGTVVNMGGAAQSKDTLQFVDIYAAKATEKLDAKGIPPLAPGQSYTFSYTSVRSKDAGAGTTTLAFQLDVQSPDGQNCSTSNDRTTVTF